MYLPLNLFLNKSSYYEDLTIELFEIIQKKREFYKEITSNEQLRNLEGEVYNEISKLVRVEYKILTELSQANFNLALDLGIVKHDEYKDDE